jgi:polysaccharide chain length determinant protein (PEP-CTERM system associated)
MSIDLQFYWGIFLRRLPVMMGLFLLCSVTALVIALKLPPTYTTSAKLLVEEAQIPESMLRTGMQVDSDQQLQVIQQRVLTRANLLDVARRYNVFIDISRMSPDEIVDQMRSQTRIRRSGGRRGQAIVMDVTFEARSARVAANVVNEYVTLILEKSTELRLSRTEGTLSFFEQEVERLSDDLDVQSARIVSFKNENGDALPDDLAYRQNRQTLLQERQARLEREIAALESQRRDLVTVGQASLPDARLSPEAQQLRDLRAQLQQSLTVYSESHPRVTFLRNQIEALETRLETPPDPSDDGADTAGPPTVLQVTLTEIDQRLESHRQELDDVVAELEQLNASIQATAGNAIVLEGLERDYQNTQNRYNEAVASLNRAMVSERVEVSARGERITVLENATVPNSPSGPNRSKLIAAGVGAGGALAVGFFLLLEVLNRAIRRPAELQSRFGIIPLAVIPHMESPRERFIRRAALVAAFVAVLIGVPAALWYVDTSYMPLDVLASKIIDRLGFG